METLVGLTYRALLFLVCAALVSCSVREREFWNRALALVVLVPVLLRLLSLK